MPLALTRRGRNAAQRPRENPMIRFRHCLLLLLVILASAPLAAQQPSFLIERVEVRGVRFASDDVVARESLVVPGRTYTEPQLRDAMSRINRLPFVLDSSFSLEKGTTRGSYVLVISVVETKPLFAEAIFGSQSQSGTTRTDDRFALGGRLFIGSSSLVHLTTDLDQNYEAGITQYNLFGRPGYVSASVRWTSRDTAGSFVYPDGTPGEYDADLDPSPRVRFGLPLFGNHSIVGSWERTSQTNALRFGDEPWEESHFEQMSSEVAWLFDTTDDPILPISGTLWRTGLRMTNGEWESSIGGQPTLTETTGRGVFSSYMRHEPLRPWLSFNYGISAGVGRMEIDRQREGPIPFVGSSYGSLYYEPRVGVSASLWSDRLTRKYGDLRFLGSVRHLGSDTFDHEFASPSSPDFTVIDAEIVQRNVWGTLRLVFSYDVENE